MAGWTPKNLRQPFAHRHTEHEELDVVPAGDEGLAWLAIGPAGAGDFETRPA